MCYNNNYKVIALIDIICILRPRPNKCMAWCSVPGLYTSRISQSRCLTPYKPCNVSRVCGLVQVECQCHDIAGTVRFVCPCRYS
jgi:hypothetical protein